MYAGKSTRAVITARQWQNLGKRVITLKPAIDTRYGRNTAVYTHDDPGAKLECYPIETLDLRPRINPDQPPAQYMSADVVIVEEAQFFATGLVDFCLTAAEADGKRVYVYGLDGTAKREAFGEIHKLCAVADTFTKCAALCQLCADGTPAPFTTATKELPQGGILVGGRDIYMAVCRSHYVAEMTS
jgi:thymidine kinase